MTLEQSNIPPINPLVTIFIPTFNRARYLDDCLYSVLVQDYPNYEVFIRDNASPDNTPDVVKKYEAQFKNRAGFRYRRNDTNVGERNNVVHGVAECRGKYTIILMDDDFLCSRTAISTFVRALQATEKTALAVATMFTYLEGQEKLTPKEIIDLGRNQTACASFTTVPGEKYFLNSWTKYGPLCFSATMFDTQLLLASPWAEWTRRAGQELNASNLLSLNRNVAVIQDSLTYYRLHGSQDIRSLPVENVCDSHSHILKWYQYARKHSGISWASLFIWRLKTVILKDEGPIKWLHDRKEPQLEPFLHWLRQYNYLHYLLLRYLCPQMIRYDYEAAAKTNNKFIRMLRIGKVVARRKVSTLILRIDRIVHDSEYRHNMRGKILRLNISRQQSTGSTA